MCTQPPPVFELVEFLPQIDLARIPIIRNVLDFREYFLHDDTDSAIPLGIDYLERTRVQREELRCSLTHCSRRLPHQQWIDLAKRTVEKASDYLLSWSRLDNLLCCKGDRILQRYPNGTVKHIPFSWRGPVQETGTLGVSLEDCVMSYCGAPAFETAMLQATLAILKWFIANTYAVSRGDFISARHNYSLAACDFSYCASFLRARIPYTPCQNGQYTSVRCLDPELYLSLSHAMNAAGSVCEIYARYNLNDKVTPALLYATGQLYEKACMTLTHSKQIQGLAQHVMFQNWRAVIICAVLRAAQLLDGDTGKNLGRHAWATSIVESVFHYTDPSYDFPTLVERVSWWRAHFWKQNSDIYRNNVPISTDGNGAMKSAIEVLTPYLFVAEEEEK